MDAIKKPLAYEDLEHVLCYAEESFRSLEGSRIFITGGTGFFGIWLLESLAFAVKNLGISVHATILTRDAERATYGLPHLSGLKWLQFHTGDVRDFQSPEGSFSHCIHAATAASAQLSAAEPLTMFDTCLAGTRRTLEFADASGIRRFLFTSSGAVYGPQPSHLERVPEDWLGGPDTLSSLSCYAEGKRAAEHLCALWAKQLQVQPIIARCWAFLGPHLPIDSHFAAGNFLGNALRREPIQISGDGTAERSYLYAADLAIWLWTLLVKGQPLRPYNVGSADATSIRRLAETVAASVNPALPVVIETPPNGSALPTRYVPDVSRAATELGLLERVALLEGVRRTLNWEGSIF